MKYFNIQMAAQISGLTTHTIRAWEKRYRALTPGRSETGRRQYTSEEIERLTLLSQLTNLGNSIGQIAHLPNEELKSILEMLNHSQEQVRATSPTLPKKSELNIEATHHNLLMALTGYKMDIISHELNKAKAGLTPRDFALEILSPLLKEVQTRQNNRSLSVPQVQALYAIIKFHVGNVIYSHYEKKVRSQNKVALATPEGEFYLFDILLSALLCCQHQMNFFFMSSNLQAPSLIEAVNAVEANIVIIGVSKLENLKRSLSYYLEELLSTLPEKCEIWLVGGSGFKESSLPRKGNFKIIPDYRTLDKLLNGYS